MKKKLISGICVFLGLFLYGCSAQKQTQTAGMVAVPEQSQKIFAYQDSLYDDRGNGRYNYPVNLENKEGIFDLKGFEVIDRGDMVEFVVEFRRPLDPELSDGSSYGRDWVYQLVDIYIDQDHLTNSGSRFSLPGRQVEFNEDEGWERVITLTPGYVKETRDWILNNLDQRDLYEVRENVIVPYDVYSRSHALRAKVRKSELGQNPSSEWGYQVFVMGFDKNSFTRTNLFVATVSTFATDANFGGGSDYEGNPNLIDILSPNKDAQYKVLSSFQSSPDRNRNLLAIVPMIYAKGKQNRPENRKNSMSRRDSEIQSPLIEKRYISQ